MPVDEPTTTAALDAPEPRETGVLAHYDQPVAAAAIKQIEKQAGGRAELVASLLSAGAVDDGLSYVIGLIADPRNDARSLGRVCAQGGVTVGELIEAYKRGAMARGTVEAIQAIATQIGPVVADIMHRAQVHEEPCQACGGSGSVRKQDADVPCAPCFGTGVRRYLPSVDRQKLAADLGRMLPKKAPLVDQSDRRSVAVGMGDPSSAGFTKILAAVDQTLHRRPSPIVEADVVEGGSPEPETDERT